MKDEPLFTIYYDNEEKLKYAINAFKKQNGFVISNTRGKFVKKLFFRFIILLFQKEILD